MVYRDSHGHFVSKQEDGERCPHGFEKGMESAFESNGIKGKPSKDYKKAIDDFRERARQLPRDRYGEIDTAKAKQLGFDAYKGTVTLENVLGKQGLDYEYHPNPVAVGTKEERYRVSHRRDGRTITEEKDNLEDAIQWLDEMESGDQEWYSRRESERKEREGIADRWLSSTDEEIDESFSDEVLTKGTRVGGYSGISRSKSAEASEELGSKPISKWTAKDILEEIEKSSYSDELEPFRDKLENLSLAGLKRVTLYHDGWHHVGINATPTDFYAISSPRDIVKNLKQEMAGTLDKNRLSSKPVIRQQSEWERQQQAKMEEESKRQERIQNEELDREFKPIEAKANQEIQSFKSKVDGYAKANRTVSRAGNPMIDIPKARTAGFDTWGSATNLSFVKKAIIGDSSGYDSGIDLVYNPTTGKVSYRFDVSDYDSLRDAYSQYRKRNKSSKDFMKGFRETMEKGMPHL